MSVTKFTVSGLNSNDVATFFKNSHLGDDQTIDVLCDKLQIKAANKSRTNMIYRKMDYPAGFKISGTLPDGGVTFFIQSYSILKKVSSHFKSEKEITLTFTSTHNKCSKISFSSSSVTYDIFSSAEGLSSGDYIHDEKFATISTPDDPTIIMSITQDKISEIVGLHKLSKSDTEILNVMTVSSDDDKNLVLSHTSYVNEVVFRMGKQDGVSSCEIGTQKYIMSLDIFNNLSGKIFTMKMTTKGGLKAVYLLDENSNLNICALTIG